MEPESSLVKVEPRTTHAPRLWSLAIASLMAFVLVATLVAVGATQALDDSIRQMFRPDDVWGTSQRVLVNFADGASPPVALSLLVVAGLAASARERAIRPLIYIVLLAGSAIAVTATAKIILDRPDLQGSSAGIGGAFPSGHMVTLIVCLAGAIIVFGLQSHWWTWAPAALVASLMAVSLLNTGMHWFTDVVGGVLLAIPVIAFTLAFGDARHVQR